MSGKNPTNMNWFRRQNLLTAFFGRGIGRRFAIDILIFSSLVTLVITAIQLAFDYYRDVGIIENRLHEIEIIYQDTLSTAVWVHNRNSLHLQLNGILRLPDMLAVQVEDERGEAMAAVGTRREVRVIERSFPLSYPHRGRSVPLGMVHLSADLGAVYQRLLDKVVVILITQTVKTFLVSLFILLLFYRLVGYHLLKLGQAARDIGRGAPDLLPESQRDDELGELTRALNMMIGSLSRSRDEIGRMAVVMAHHFQEPVRRMVTFAQRLRQTAIPGRLEKGELESLDFIESEARRLRNIVRDIQVYLSAWEAGPGQTAVDSSAVLQTELSKLVGGDAQDVHVCVGQLPAVRIDRDCLHNLFAALLDNASKYRRPDRRLEVHIWAEQLSGRAKFHFSDNGAGIPEEYRERVFTLFERLASGTDASGVGLSVARKIVETVGGHIAIEDMPGGGTTVVFDIPLADTDQTTGLIPGARG